MELEQTILNSIEPSLSNMGFDVVQVKFYSTSPRTLQIMIERQDGVDISIDDCTNASHHVSALLDVEDPISGEYNLEMSSPGLDRPLVKKADYTRFTGETIKLVTAKPIDGQKRYKGVLEGCENDEIKLKLEESDQSISIPFTMIEKANIIPDENLFKIEG